VNILGGADSGESERLSLRRERKYSINENFCAIIVARRARNLKARVEKLFFEIFFKTLKLLTDLNFLNF
jgi:hypothetical protein